MPFSDSFAERRPPCIRALFIYSRCAMLDDFPLVLERQTTIELIGRARNLAEGLTLLRKKPVDFIVAHLRLSDSPAHLDTARTLRKTAPACRIIGLTPVSHRVLDRLRDCELDLLLDEKTSTQHLASAIFRLIRSSDGFAAREPLTTRENDIAQLAAEGLSRAVIAKRLFVTENTVKTHLTRVYRKLGVRNRFELVRQWAVGEDRRRAVPLPDLRSQLRLHQDMD